MKDSKHHEFARAFPKLFKGNVSKQIALDKKIQGKEATVNKGTGRHLSKKQSRFKTRHWPKVGDKTIGSSHEDYRKRTFKED